nr:HNH endonuclease [Brasilonema bromeliae]
MRPHLGHERGPRAARPRRGETANGPRSGVRSRAGRDVPSLRAPHHPDERTAVAGGGRVGAEERHRTRLVRGGAIVKPDTWLIYEDVPPDAKEIPGYPGYFVSDGGKVWNTNYFRRPHVLRPLRSAKGHLSVQLWVNGKPSRQQVHRIVLLAFVGPCPEGMEACHFPDPDPSNNFVANLRWDTSTENSADQKRLNRHPHGVKHGQAKLTEDDVREIRRLRSEGKLHREIALIFGISRKQVSDICIGRYWSHVA